MEGVTYGSFDSIAPKLQDMLGKEGGADQRGDPCVVVVPFWGGGFLPKLMDIMEKKLDFSSCTPLTLVT